MTRLFIPEVYVAGWIAVASVLVAYGLWGVHHAHAARQAEQRACAAEVRAWKLANPALAGGVVARGDACATLSGLTGRRP